MIAAYRRLFAAPGTAAFEAAGFVARMAHLMTVLSVVFLISAVTGSYGLGGAVAAAYAVAYSLASPLLSRLVDRYRLATWPQISSTLARQGPAELIRQVRAAEEADADGRRWPRAKLRDDATAIYWPVS